MKSAKYCLLLTVVAILCLHVSANAENVTVDEARQIANNWISMIVQQTGGWGDHQTASIASVEEFRSDSRLLGYYCTVQPDGFIVVSLVKGLAPVKVYSDNSWLDPEADSGPAGLIKFQMGRLIHELELQLGPVDELSSDEVQEALVYKHVETLNRLNVPSGTFQIETLSAGATRDYIEEEILLTSFWHQFDPYFRQVPDASAGCTETNCAVGCVATAAAQIMRYWSWPPGRGWLIMPDYADGSSTTETITAVSELCASIGSAVGMDYCSDGCQSSVPTADMVPVYDAWHYADPVLEIRDEYSAAEWWQMCKAHVSVNEPIQYRIEGHSIVLDGWREWVTGTYQPEYHMNYGWGDTSFNAWYELDELFQVVDGAGWEQEYMIRNIVPGPSLHSSVTGPQIKWPFNYRYVNRDCTAHAADFYPGQFIQFLPGVTLVCTEASMRFSGETREDTYLYAGEPERGIKIQNGAMVFYPGGGIRFQLSRPGP